MENGSRLYLDVGSHPEYATPECDSVYDVVTHDKAGERILEQLLQNAEKRLREEGIDGRLYLFKNNTDSAGNSYGSHENYCTTRSDDISHYDQVLIPFLSLGKFILGLGKYCKQPEVRRIASVKEQSIYGKVSLVLLLEAGQ